MLRAERDTHGSLLRSTARQRKEAVTVPNLPRPTAGDSNRRPGLAMTHGVRARHDQLTNAALAASFGALTRVVLSFNSMIRSHLPRMALTRCVLPDMCFKIV
jgi:hypothetical protein